MIDQIVTIWSEMGKGVGPGNDAHMTIKLQYYCPTRSKKRLNEPTLHAINLHVYIYCSLHTCVLLDTPEHKYEFNYECLTNSNKSMPL